MFFDGLFHFFYKIFFFTSYVNNNGSFPKPLPQEEERECLTKYREQGDRDARDKLIRHNLRLVAHIVKKYSSSGCDVDDLISVGSIGLIKAIETFKPEKNVALATFAARCIENEILMLLRSQKKYRGNVSLNEPVGVDRDGNELVLIDLISVKQKSVIDNVESKILTEKLMEIVKRVLSEREYEIICARYGLNGMQPETQREVAKRLKISRSYISCIEKKAISKIRDEVVKTELFID